MRMLYGAFVWALHFMAAYGFTALACERGFASVQWLGIGVVTWALGAATVIALGVTSVIIVAATWRAPRIGFTEWITAGIAALASIAILWEALPAIMVPGCA